MNRTIWILLRHGSKAWPIQVVDNVLRDVWDDFKAAHDIRTNYKLILGCERKWVFDAIILNQYDAEVWYDWTMLENPHW